MRSRTLRTALVGVLVFVMTVDSATAFHLFGGGFRGCGRMGGGGGGWIGHRSAGHSSCGSCSSCDSCGSATVSYHDSCGCAGGYVEGGHSSGTIVTEQRAPDAVYPSTQPQLAPQDPATVNRMEQQNTFVPQTQTDGMSRPGAGGTQRYPETYQQPSTTVPLQDPPSSTTRPAERRSLDDIFQPTTPSTGTSSAQETTTTQTPSTGTTPAGDVFVPTTPSTPTTETPAATTPTTPPATTPPATGGLDDLFGPASGGTTPPAGGGGTTPPAGGTTPPATSGGSTPPATGVATPPAATGTSLPDDLFGPASGGTTPTTPTTPPATEPTTPPVDDLFKSSAVLRENGGLASDQNREWVDNTGRYQTRGRLVSFLDGHVRLLKDNGRTTTVPLTRLSQNDLEFVNRQASAQRDSRYSETVQTEVAVPLAAN